MRGATDIHSGANVQRKQQLKITNRMKQLIIPILILIFTSCNPGQPNCRMYYFYSEIHLNTSINEDPNYIISHVEERVYTAHADTESAYNLYLRFWPDAKITYVGCPDTLKFKNTRK